MLLPEIWAEISKRLPVQDLKNLRLSSRLLYIASTEQLYDKCKDSLFVESARNGCIVTLTKIYNHCSNKPNNLTEPFRCAAENGHLNIVRQIYDWVKSDKEKVNMIADIYFSFRMAVENGHTDIVRLIYDWVPSDREKVNMIGHLKTIQQLYPWVPSDREKVIGHLKTINNYIIGSLPIEKK